MFKSTIRRRNRNNDQVLETKIENLKKEDVLIEQLNFEIECPRCSDIMELFSEFDHLSYYCGSCRLELNIN
jgi:late competence protein required for DNA uptake (superfamily II DNA/RNA helicase)